MKKVLILVALCLFAAVALPAIAAQDRSAAPAHEGATAAAEHAPAEHAAEATHKTYFGIPAWLLKTINVLGFLWLLWWWLKAPIGKALAERREGIRAKLSEAAERRHKADNLASDIEKRLGQIEKEIEGILSRAREEGERQKTEIVATAEQESERILEAATNQIDQRLKQARRELTDYAGVLATEKARTMVEANLTDDDRHHLFDDSIRQIREAKS